MNSMKSGVLLLLFLLFIPIISSVEVVIVKDSFNRLNGTDVDGKIFIDGDINFSVTGITSQADAVCIDYNDNSYSTSNFGFDVCYYDDDGCDGVYIRNELTRDIINDGCFEGNCNELVDDDFTTSKQGKPTNGDLLYQIDYTVDTSNSYEFITYFQQMCSSSFAMCWRYDLSDWVSFHDYPDDECLISGGEPCPIPSPASVPAGCVQETPLMIRINFSENTGCVADPPMVTEFFIKDISVSPKCDNRSCHGYTTLRADEPINESVNVESFFEGVDVEQRVCDGCSIGDTSTIKSLFARAKIFYDCDDDDGSVNEVLTSKANSFNWTVGQSHAYDCKLTEGTYGGANYDYVLNYTNIGVTVDILTPSMNCDSPYTVCSELFDDTHTTDKDASLSIPCKLNDNNTCLLDSECASNNCNVTVFSRNLCDPDSNESNYDEYTTTGVGFKCTTVVANESDFSLNTDDISCGSGNYCDSTKDNDTVSGLSPPSPCLSSKVDGSVCSFSTYGDDPECTGLGVCDGFGGGIAGECLKLKHTANISASQTDDDIDDDYIVRVGQKIGLTAINSISNAINDYSDAEISYNISCACWDFNDDGTWDKAVGGATISGQTYNCPELSILQRSDVCPGVSSITSGFWSEIENRTESIITNYKVALKVLDGFEEFNVNVSDKVIVHLRWVNGTTINLTNEGQSDNTQDYVVLKNDSPISFISFSASNSTCLGCNIDYACYWVDVLNSTTSNITYNKCFKRTGVTTDDDWCTNRSGSLGGCKQFISVSNPEKQIVNFTFNDSLELTNNNHFSATQSFDIFLRIINSFGDNSQVIKSDVQFEGICEDSKWDNNEIANDYGGKCGTCTDSVTSKKLNETDIDYGGRCGFCEENIDKDRDIFFSLIRIDKDLNIFDFGVDKPLTPIKPDGKFCEESEEKIGMIGILVVLAFVLGSSTIIVLIVFIIILLIPILFQTTTIIITTTRVFRRVSQFFGKNNKKI